MLFSGGSPEALCVDAARDSMYCPQEINNKLPPPTPKPRGNNPPTPKPRSVVPTQLDSIKNATEIQQACQSQNMSPRNKQRLIKVDISLFEDDDPLTNGSVSIANQPTSSTCHQQTKVNNENNQNNCNTILRRTRNKEIVTITQDEYHRFCDTALESYDLATQCESRRSSMRRHTIVGCQSISRNESHSTPPPVSRPESRQSEISAASTATSIEPTVTDTWSKNSMDEKEWKESMNVNDRLSLTLEEIVHIRSVMTKAELEGLPVGIQVKEDVEKKKICFLCLRTRFSLFGPRGVQCKLCKRTVCSKCYSKMRIPTEHFRNVPVVLLSPSLMSSPVGSQVSSPSHHGHHPPSAGGFDENFPRSLMERLMRPEFERKTCNTVGSAPSSPKQQRSTSSTPGSSLQHDTTHMSLPLNNNNNAPSTSTSTTTANGVLGVKGNTTNSSRNSLMTRSMEGPRSLPPQSPARPHSNNSTLDRRTRFANAFSLTSSTTTTHTDHHKEALRGEMMSVCNDCRGLVLEIIRSSRQTRSSARNQAIKNLTLDLSPVYKF